MKTTEVKITEMNSNEVKTFTFDFESSVDLIQQIDDAIDNTKWQNDNLNLEIIVDDCHFTKEELEMLEDENVIITYIS
jgi:hypothetical protein